MKESSFPSPKEKIEELGQRVDRLRTRCWIRYPPPPAAHPRAAAAARGTKARRAGARSALPRASPAYTRALADANAFAGQTRVIELDT